MQMYKQVRNYYKLRNQNKYLAANDILMKKNV